MNTLEFVIYRVLLEFVPAGRMEDIVTMAEDMSLRENLHQVPRNEAEEGAARLAKHFTDRLLIMIEDEDENRKEEF